MGLFGFSMPGAPAIAKAGRMAAAGNSGLLPEPITKQQDTAQGGLLGFLRQAQQPGGFFERLNTFGGSLQDISDGGNRVARIEQTRAQQQATQAAAEQRMQINKMAQGLNLSGTDLLAFNANPESFVTALMARQRDEQTRAAEAAKPSYFNTSDGIYRTGTNPGWEVQFEEDPLEQELLQARIDATRAQVGQRQASAGAANARAARSNAPRASGGGGRRSSGGSSAPARAPWERSW